MKVLLLGFLNKRGTAFHNLLAFAFQDQNPSAVGKSSKCCPLAGEHPHEATLNDIQCSEILNAGFTPFTQCPLPLFGLETFIT